MTPDKFCKCGAVLASDGLCSDSEVEPNKCPMIPIDDIDNAVTVEDDGE